MGRMSEMEIRHQIGARVATGDGPGRLRGTAIVFDSLSVDLGGFREKIAPAAVDRTLTEGLDVRALADHDSGKILGRSTAGTLTLAKQDAGLQVHIAADPEISYVRDLLRSVERGDLTGMSFAFRAIDTAWDWEADPPIRTVLDMTIYEVSVVAFPAYAATDVSVALRSMQAAGATRPARRVEWLKKWHKTRLAHLV
jgi:hypothetical protein